MRARDKVKYGAVGATLALSTTAILFTTGIGQAAVSTVSSVLVTNKGAAQAVPVQQQGTTNVNVTNGSLSVSTLPAGATPWRYFVMPSFARTALFIPPAGKTTLAVTSLTVSNETSGAVTAILALYGNTDCVSSFNSYVTRVEVPAADTIAQAFPQPMVISPGGSNWCLSFGAPSSGVEILAVGYYY
jgi:hypothetical protein